MKDLKVKIYQILEHYAEFFLVDYPKLADTNSIHPTADKIMQLFSDYRQSVIERLEKEKIHIDGSGNLDEQVANNEAIDKAIQLIRNNE